MTEPTQEAPPFVCVFDDRSTCCIGHLLRRGEGGIEAYDADTVSLGIYPDLDTAARVVWRHSRAQWLDWPPADVGAVA
jgi:hypothetical protein